MKNIKLCCCPDSVSVNNPQGPHCPTFELWCEPQAFGYNLWNSDTVWPDRTAADTRPAVRSRQKIKWGRERSTFQCEWSGVTSYFPNVSGLSTAQGLKAGWRVLSAGHRAYVKCQRFQHCSPGAVENLQKNLSNPYPTQVFLGMCSDLEKLGKPWRKQLILSQGRYLYISNRNHWPFK